MLRVSARSCPTGRFVAAEPFGALTDLFGACFGTFLLKEAWLPPFRKATEMPEVFVFSCLVKSEILIRKSTNHAVFVHGITRDDYSMEALIFALQDPALAPCFRCLQDCSGTS